MDWQQFQVLARQAFWDYAIGKKARRLPKAV